MKGSMHILQRIIGATILISLAGGTIYTFLHKKEEAVNITYSTSDAGSLKGDISIALDSWIGYFPFRSPVFGKLMRDSGYRVKLVDDKADYAGRMEMLRKGEIDLAVYTVDSYLLNGRKGKFPGVIVTIIDESKGGDAIVAWKEKVSNIESLKKSGDFKIAFTPSSPSEHLLKSMAFHFDIPSIRDRKGKWAIKVNGAEEAFEKFIKKDADIAVLWEPHVTEALSHPGTVKLIGSEDVEKLIVDILVVNRNFAEKKPEVVKLFLKNYFDTLNIYNSDPQRLHKDIFKQVVLSEQQVQYMLKGVKWINYPENLQWFGLSQNQSNSRPELVESINSTINILLGNNDFDTNPLQDKDPYTIINSHFIKGLYGVSAQHKPAGTADGDSLARHFSKISDREWKNFRVVGSLKFRPISFRSGTSLLDENGRSEIKQIIESVRHYPNFRILIKGHTGLRGDINANLNLSRDRAGAVKREFQYSYNIDPNRLLVMGIGPKEPLPRNPEESDRAYDNRLKRVEILFVTK